MPLVPRGVSLAALIALTALVACGPGAENGSATAPVGAGPPVGEQNLGGLYDVSGLTTELDSGDQREIAGTIIISQDGDRYDSTFSLRTMFPTPSGPLPAEVIGRGEGQVDGLVMTGRAETQIVLSTVPGVDSSFAYVPRRVSERIVSSSVARVTEDGQVTIEIRSEPGESSSYARTSTILKGERVSGASKAIPLRR
jgi:hypothetical protein